MAGAAGGICSVAHAMKAAGCMPAACGQLWPVMVADGILNVMAG